MSELPAFRMNGESGKQYEATPDNTQLYMYLGEIGVYSHFMSQLEVDPPMFTRVFIHNNGFEEVRDFMMANGYPLHVNLREVSDGVVKSYDKDVEKQVGDIDTVPEDWK